MEKRKRGGQPGNTNALIHGFYAQHRVHNFLFFALSSHPPVTVLRYRNPVPYLMPLLTFPSLRWPSK